MKKIHKKDTAKAISMLQFISQHNNKIEIDCKVVIESIKTMHRFIFKNKERYEISDYVADESLDNINKTIILSHDEFFKETANEYMKFIKHLLSEMKLRNEKRIA